MNSQTDMQAETGTEAGREGCPAWCSRHLDARPQGGGEVHQTTLGRAGGLTLDLWQIHDDGEHGWVTVLDEQHRELFTVDIGHAAALGVLLTAAAAATQVMCSPRASA